MNIYSELFSLQSETLKALCHPKRLEIVHLLRDHEVSVGEIQNMLDLPQANLSQHLTVLRLHGLVVTNKKGKIVRYALADEKLIMACDLIREFLIENQENNKLINAGDFQIGDYLPVVTDPVCGMRISSKIANAVTEYKGKSYYFCASGCYKNFLNNPDAYLKDIK